eukprot:12640316-Ditylum_brightwellii.AAC.1
MGCLICSTLGGDGWIIGGTSGGEMLGGTIDGAVCSTLCCSGNTFGAICCGTDSLSIGSGLSAAGQSTFGPCKLGMGVEV